jgi:stearoyl-CoA desaturase (Delta-9 desaturase)
MIGWAYDLKSVSSDIVMKRVLRTGDGSHSVWGWGDKDMTAEQRKVILEINQHVKEE